MSIHISNVEAKIISKHFIVPQALPRGLFKSNQNQFQNFIFAFSFGMISF